MKLSNFVDGLTILRGYFDSDGYEIGAEHDIFYVYQTDRPLSDEHLAKLIELGWFQEGLAGGDEFKAENYDPEEGWAAFT